MANVAQADSALINGIYYDFYGGVATVISGSNYSGDVVIPETVTYNGKAYSVDFIGKRAFWNCTGLTSIFIPESVTGIGYDAFKGCTGLSSISIPDNVTFIRDGVFQDCSNLTSIAIPKRVSTIEKYTFDGCCSLTSVTIPESVTSIGECAFRNCSSLSSVTIPESVTSIGGSAFSGCSSLISITIPKRVSTIEGYTFAYCSSLSSVTIPESVTSIGECAFSECQGLTKVNFASLESLLEISFTGGSTPFNCYINGELLDSLVLPEGMTSIKGGILWYIKNLKSITIPQTVTNIDYRALSILSGGIVICYATTPPTLAYEGIKGSFILYVPRMSIDTYKTSEYWKYYSSNIYAIEDKPDVTIHSTYVSHPVYYDYDEDGVMEMYAFYNYKQNSNATQNFGITDDDGLIRSILPFSSSNKTAYDSLIKMICSNNIPKMANGNGDINIGNYIIQKDDSVLTVPSSYSILSFADIDNDGRLDAIENASSMFLQMDDGAFFNFTPQIVIDSTFIQRSAQGQNRVSTRRKVIGMSLEQALAMNNVVSGINHSSIKSSENFGTMDLNGDGKLDLITSDKKSAYMSVGDNSYCPVSFVGKLFPYDLDGNGILDYIVYDGNNVYTMICNTYGGATQKKIFENKNVKKVLCRDFDHDDDVDVLVYIIDYSANKSYFVFLRNDGNGTFKKKESYIEDKWDIMDCKDYDCDGLYEVLLRSSENQIIKINKDYTLTYVYEQLVGEMNQMLFNIGDYDNDGYMDFKLVDGSYSGFNGDVISVNSGYLLRSGLYPNQTHQNTRPEKMGKPIAIMDENTGFLRIIWERGHDAETSACDLTYEVRIGTAPGKGDVLFAPSLADGRRRVVADGAMGTQLQTFFNIAKHPEGKYYVAVQAIDAGGLGGPWSDEAIYENVYFAPHIIVENTSVSTADTIVVKANIFDNGVSCHWAVTNGEIVEQEGREAKVVFHAAGKQQVVLTSVKNDVEYVSEPLSFSVKAYKGNTYIDDRKIEYNVMKYLNLLFFDINQDGYPDGIGNNVFQWNDGKGNLSKYPKSFNSDLSITNPKILDLNRDGFPDVIASYSSSQKGNIFINDEEGDFEYEKRQLEYTNGSEIKTLGLSGEFVDFTNSGLNDFICNEGLLASNDYITFDKIPMDNFNFNYNGLCDLNRDGYTDIIWSEVRSYYDIRNYYALINQGDRTFYKLTMLEMEYSNGVYKIADLNNDGIMDIISPIPYSTDLGIYSGKFENGVYSWDLARTVGVSFTITDIVIQDFDNNGYLDLELIDKNSSNVITWRILYFDENFEYYETVLSSLDKYGYNNYNLPFVVLNDNGYPLMQQSTIKNEKPKAPSTVSVRQTTEGMVINWTDAEDDHTPGVQMRYNVSVKRKGKSGPDSYVISPMNGGDSNAALVFPWYYKQSTTMTVPISALTAGETYEVQVQAIDLWNQWSPMTEPVEFTISADGGMIEVPDMACVGRETTVKYTGALGTGATVDFGTDSKYTRNGNSFCVTWSSEGLKDITIGNHHSQIIVENPIDVSFTLPKDVFVGAALPVNISKEMTEKSINGSFCFVSYPKGARTSVNYSPAEGKAWLTFDKPGYYEVEARCVDDVRDNSLRLSFEAQDAPVTEIKSVDVSDGHYTVGWNTSDLPNSVKKVIIYKEGNRLNQFNVLDTVVVSEGQYVDRTSSPNAMSERYKLGFMSDGGQILESMPHKPLHVMITTSASGGYNILWNAYEGLTVDNYRIWRGTSPDKLDLLSQVAGSQQSFTDFTTPSGEVFYAVSFSPISSTSVKGFHRASYAGDDVCSNVVSTRSAASMVLASSLSIVTLMENPSLTDDSRTLQLYSILLPTYCTYNKVAWSIVEGEEFAELSPNGLLTAKEGKGNVRVRVSSLDGSNLTDEITVYVDVPEYIDQEVIDGVERMKSDRDVTEVARYNLHGIRISAPQKGINIIRMSDGTTRKVMIK